jgi:hypothetical protein
MAKRRAFKKPKPPKPDPEWTRLPLIEKLAQELIAQHHQHLERAKIVVLGKPKAGKRGEKVVDAVGVRPSKALQALWKESAGEDLHYVIVIGRTEWDAMTPARRRIVLDSILNKFIGLDEKGRWTLRKDYDVEVDLPILRRYGAHTVELELLAKEAKQMGLFEKRAGA